MTLGNSEILKLTAWPIDLLQKRTGEPVGLLMPKIAGRKDIHHLYSPKSRRADFQRADWRFLVRAAARYYRKPNARSHRPLVGCGATVNRLN